MSTISEMLASEKAAAGESASVPAVKPAVETSADAAREKAAAGRPATIAELRTIEGVAAEFVLAAAEQGLTLAQAGGMAAAYIAATAEMANLRLRATRLEQGLRGVALGDAPQPLAADAQPDLLGGDETQWKAAWAANAKLRAEFRNQEEYLAYCRNKAKRR